MGSIYEQAQAFRANLIKRDSAAINLLTNEYRAIYARLARQLDALNSQIAEAQRGGQAVSRSWINQQWRYQSFLRDLDREFAAYADFTGQLVQARQFFEANQGANDAAAMIGGAFNRLPFGAIQNIVGALQADSPLGKLFDSFGAVASQKVKGALRDGIALGWNPRRSARQVRDALGVPLSRALLISRTESVRAYRHASIQQYRDAGILRWRWTAAKSARTCLNCLARDGEIYETRKPFPGHPACRCTLTPILDDAPLRRETGKDWFNRQPDTLKREMTSGVAFDLMKQGKLKLDDFKGSGHSRKWGPFTYERSVREILGG